MFNLDTLKARIINKYGDFVSLGSLMGFSKQKINSRLTGATEFSLSEIEKAVDLLSIKPEEIEFIFFRKNSLLFL